MKDVRTKMMKTEEMYSFCVDMLMQGKVLFPPGTTGSNAPMTVTPMKPKLH